MKQPDDVYTLDLVSEAQIVEALRDGPYVRDGCATREVMRAAADLLEAKALTRGRRPGQRCGPYQGAGRADSGNMTARIKTGKTQAEFAALCGISERTLRTWEKTGNVATTTGAVILAKLRELGGCQSALRRPVKFRDPMTGSTWSGRGQMPIWLRVALHAKGRSLADFQTR